MKQNYEAQLEEATKDRVAFHEEYKELIPKGCICKKCIHTICEGGTVSCELNKNEFLNKDNKCDESDYLPNDKLLKFIINKDNRIVAMHDFELSSMDLQGKTEVKAGQIGGIVDNYYNLSQFGKCWIDYDSEIEGNFGVHNDVLVLASKIKTTLGSKPSGSKPSVHYISDKARLVRSQLQCVYDTEITGNAEIDYCEICSSKGAILISDNAKLRNTHINSNSTTIIKDNAIIFDCIVSDSICYSNAKAQYKEIANTMVWKEI